MISLEVKNDVDSEWNLRLQKSELATIYQTREWGLIVNEIGKKPKFLEFVNEEGKIIGQLLIFTYSRFQSKRILRKIIKKFPEKIFTTCSWTYGPIIFEKESTSDIMHLLSDYLINNVSKVKGVGHPFLNPDSSFQSPNFKVQKWITFMIDLSKPKEDIYKKINKHSGIKNIERAIRRKVTTEEITEDSLKDYIELVNSEKKTHHKLNLNNAKKIWNLLKPFGYSGILAKQNDIPVAGLLFSYLNGHIIEAGVVRSEKDRHENLYAQDLIRWKIIEWGIKNKMKFYNFAGANPNPKSSKEEGILRYKQKWGGEQFTYWILSI